MGSRANNNHNNQSERERRGVALASRFFFLLLRLLFLSFLFLIFHPRVGQTAPDSVKRLSLSLLFRLSRIQLPACLPSSFFSSPVLQSWSCLCPCFPPDSSSPLWVCLASSPTSAQLWPYLADP
ncbi:hypothetical protein BDW74DRAFT_28664 [Aspergillus multicolor]|uniref:uncharacterized protein n=1 Tax=Aspergillus multicolor TaxID=41759 RepID=UPI003CCCF429